MTTKVVCKIREAYAVETGDYAGQVFVVINIGEAVDCLSLPSMDNVHIPKESFISGRNAGIITLLERIPRLTFKVSKAQYIKNENANNRRE